MEDLDDFLFEVWVFQEQTRREEANPFSSDSFVLF